MASIVTVFCDSDGGSVAVKTSLSQAFPASQLYHSEAQSWCVLTGLPGDYGEWHTVTSPLLSIVVSGEWEVEVTSGDSHIMKTGDIMFATDTQGKGHRSRVLSDKPCTVIGVGINQLPPSIQSLFCE